MKRRDAAIELVREGETRQVARVQDICEDMCKVDVALLQGVRRRRNTGCELVMSCFVSDSCSTVL